MYNNSYSPPVLYGGAKSGPLTTIKDHLHRLRCVAVSCDMLKNDATCPHRNASAVFRRVNSPSAALLQCTTRMCSNAYAYRRICCRPLWLSVCPAVCHTPVLHRNGVTVRAVFMSQTLTSACPTFYCRRNLQGDSGLQK